MANITLLSDLGLQDASAGIVKGVLYSAVQGAIITDITHEVTPFDIEQAAYILGAVYTNFPKHTIHLALVDVFYDSLPKMILAECNEQYLLAPDNGLIPAALGQTTYKAWVCHEVAGNGQFDTWLQAAATVVQRLQQQTPAEMGLQAYSPRQLEVFEDKSNNNTTVLCRILYVDNFGNLVTDMTRDKFSRLNKNGRFTVLVGVDTITKISSFYTEVVKGDPLCRFNSRGYMEICVNKGNASALLGFRVGGIYNDIKISFE